jgi:hypothetical protein
MYLFSGISINLAHCINKQLLLFKFLSLLSYFQYFKKLENNKEDEINVRIKRFFIGMLVFLISVIQIY